MQDFFKYLSADELATAEALQAEINSIEAGARGATEPLKAQLKVLASRGRQRKFNLRVKGEL